MKKGWLLLFVFTSVLMTKGMNSELRKSMYKCDIEKFRRLLKHQDLHDNPVEIFDQALDQPCALSLVTEIEEKWKNHRRCEKTAFAHLYNARKKSSALGLTPFMEALSGHPQILKYYIRDK